MHWVSVRTNLPACINIGVRIELTFFFSFFDDIKNFSSELSRKHVHVSFQRTSMYLVSSEHLKYLQVRRRGFKDERTVDVPVLTL